MCKFHGVLFAQLLCCKVNRARLFNQKHSNLARHCSNVRQYIADMIGYDLQVIRVRPVSVQNNMYVSDGRIVNNSLCEIPQISARLMGISRSKFTGNFPPIWNDRTVRMWP